MLSFHKKTILKETQSHRFENVLFVFNLYIYSMFELINFQKYYFSIYHNNKLKYEERKSNFSSLFLFKILPYLSHANIKLNIVNSTHFQLDLRLLCNRFFFHLFLKFRLDESKID